MYTLALLVREKNYHCWLMWSELSQYFSLTRPINIMTSLFSGLVICNHTQRPTHSVESPSMVVPKWNIYCFGGPSEFFTQSAEVWLAVSGGKHLFGITYVCFIPSRLPVFAVGPQHQHRYLF